MTLFSIPMDLITLGIMYYWNHTVFSLGVWFVMQHSLHGSSMLFMCQRLSNMPLHGYTTCYLSFHLLVNFWFPPPPPPAPLFGDIVKSTGVQAYDQMSDFNYFSYSLINAWWRVTYLFPEAA